MYFTKQTANMYKIAEEKEEEKRQEEKIAEKKANRERKKTQNDKREKLMSVAE